MASGYQYDEETEHSIREKTTDRRLIHIKNFGMLQTKDNYFDSEFKKEDKQIKKMKMK